MSAIDDARRQSGDDLADVKLAVNMIGPDAKPSGRLRQVKQKAWGLISDPRLQQEWVGEFGAVWLDVPTIIVPMPMPKLTESTNER